jgi:hypothetical protein
VAASVKWPPIELFLVVVTIKPAKANKDMDKMTKDIKTSINVNPAHRVKTRGFIGCRVKPFDFTRIDLREILKLDLRKMYLRSNLQNPYQNIFNSIFINEWKIWRRNMLKY